MMNALALSLLVSSLAAAGMFSPTPPKQGANTIVKEGHRVVVVEYDQDGHQNTKISISPPEPDHSDSNLLDNARDKIKEAASVFPNMPGTGMAGSSSSHSQDAFLHAPKDLICDAYGRCKHKIADAMGKAKDKAQEAIEKKKDIDGAVADAVGKAKDTVYDKAKETVEKGMDTGQTMKDHVVRNVSQATHTVKRFASTALGPLDSSVMGVANLLGFATAYGMCVWITFISSYVLSKAMPRQQFVVVQSKIYPVYFRAMAYTVGIALLGHVLGHRNTLFTSKPQMLQAYNLLASLLTIFFNSLYLEPRATKVYIVSFNPIQFTFVSSLQFFGFEISILISFFSACPFIR